MPAFFVLLRCFVLVFCVFPCSARRCNFLRRQKLSSGDILHQLVHLGDSLVVLLKTSNLSVQKTVLFVAHFQVFLQALHIRPKLLVFICNLYIEVLLEVQVTFHVRDLSVPEIELTPLLGIILLHQGDASRRFPNLAFLFS